MTDEIACTCKCSPEEHGPNGCKTWFGDRNTGFGCNCDWSPRPEKLCAAATPMDKIRTATFIALDKGFTNLCLECLGGFNEAVCPKCAKPLRSTHQDRLALDCGRLIIEMLQQKEAAGVGIRGLVFGWSHEVFRQEIAQIILKNGFEKL